MRMSKRILEMRNIPYEVRLKALNLHYLERYRLKGDQTEVFKGYNNCTKVDMNKVLGSIAKIEPEIMGSNIVLIQWGVLIKENWTSL